MRSSGPPCRRSVLYMAVAALLAVPSLAHAQTFPDKPFNGLQVSYSISGATLSAPSDGGPMEGWIRSYSGTLGTGTLRVTGSFMKSGIKGGEGYVLVTAGSQRAEKAFDLRTPAIAGRTAAFDVSAPIAADAVAGSISVTFRADYGNGESRFVTVKGSFTREVAAKPTPPTTTNAPRAMSAEEFLEQVIGFGDSAAAGRWRYSGLTAQVVRGVARFSDPSSRQGVPVEPGREAALYPGASIETGVGTMVRLLFTDRSSFLVKPSSRATIGYQGLVLQAGQMIYLMQGLVREFQINVPNAAIRSLGTVFAVKVSPDGAYTTLAVKESKAWISDPKGKARMVVPAGYYSVMKKGGRPAKPARMSAKQMEMYFGELSLLRAPVAAAPKPDPTAPPAASVTLPNLTGDWSVMHNTYPGTLRLQQTGMKLTGTMYASKLLEGEVCADGTVKWTRDDCQQKWVGRYSKDAQGRDVLSGVFWCPVAKNWNTKWTATRIR